MWPQLGLNEALHDKSEGKRERLIGMDLPSDTVLVFVLDKDEDEDEDLIVFEPFVHATNHLEAIDVSDGDYTAGYAPDGGVLALTAPGGPEGSVVLTMTGRGDLADLERRVARYWQRHQVDRPPCVHGGGADIGIRRARRETVRR